VALNDIQRDFPLLTPDNFAAVSDEDFNYNCLAFVLGDIKNWWEPPGEFGFYWPPGFAADVTVNTAAEIVKLHGYTVEAALDITPLTESIAIFAKDQEWTHFARYAGDRWVSKLGEDHDISHTSLDILEGDLYGRVVRILSRETL
jgi:hypothetical protein